MPRKTYPEIINSVYDRIDGAVGLLRVKKEDKGIDNNDMPYIEVLIRPDATQADTIGSNSLSGDILFNVYFKKGDGVHDPAVEGQKLIDLFPQGDVFDGIEIPAEGTIYGPQDGVDKRKGWRFTPTVIPYEAQSCFK